MAQVDDVAAALLLRVETVNTEKLQKLAYYGQAWHLVVPALYRQHKRMYQVSDWKSGDPQSLSSAEVGTIESIVINHDQMRLFYSRQRTDPDITIAQAAASAAMEGASLDNDWQSVLRDVAAGTRSAAKVIEEEINRARNSDRPI